MKSLIRRFGQRLAVTALVAMCLAAGAMIAHATVTTSLSTISNISIQGTLSATPGGLAPLSSALQRTFQLTTSQGTSTGMADMLYSAERTLTASSTETLSLSDSTLKDAAGNAFIPLHIKAIYVFPLSTNTNNVVVGNGTNPVLLFSAATTTISIPPGGAFVWTNGGQAGTAVVAATSDGLKIANGSSGTSVVYDLVIIGTST